MHEKCTRCSPGTYQNQEGRFECSECPEGTYTLGEDSKNFTACRGIDEHRNKNPLMRMMMVNVIIMIIIIIMFDLERRLIIGPLCC